MASTFEQYERLICPNDFYSAGIPRIRFVLALAATLPFGFMTLSKSHNLIVTGYIGTLALAGIVAFYARRRSLRHWSLVSKREIKRSRERDAFVVEQLVDALLAMYHRDPCIAQRELAVELPHAMEALEEERASRAAWSPRWLGPLMSGCLTAALAFLARADTPIGLALLGIGAAGAFLFVFVTVLIDLVVPRRVFGLAGYVRLLRLAKRRVDLQLVAG